MASGIVGSKSTNLPAIAGKVPDGTRKESQVKKLKNESETQANSAAGHLREAGHEVHEPKRQLQPQVRPPRAQRARTKLRATPAALFGRARSGRPNGRHNPPGRAMQNLFHRKIGCVCKSADATRADRPGRVL
jgi:hypothetical protein